MLRRLLGLRLPVANGRLQIEGLQKTVRIRRDRFGIPYIEAETEDDVWYGLGFCHGQDRCVQADLLRRVATGRLAEIFGPPALKADRFARRVGFRRAGERQLALIDATHCRRIEAYARGLSEGSSRGLPDRAHEHALLLVRPQPFSALDVLAILKFQAFLVSANWDSELARLNIVQLEGLATLKALDPALREEGAGTTEPRWRVNAERLMQDASALRRRFGAGFASNGWVLAGRRTASGAPILSNDPHLPPMLPSQWYLAHLRTPDWAVAGACFVGLPAILAGHNGRVAWGLTAALADTVDLFLEEFGVDRASVRRGAGYEPVEIMEEHIAVRGWGSVIERVASTSHGPIVGPALRDSPGAIALSATYLQPRPLSGFLDVHLTRDFNHLRTLLAEEVNFSFLIYYAGEDGTIGLQLIGRPPKRKAGCGMMPRPGGDPGSGWDGLVPFEHLPFQRNPQSGIIAGANNRPYEEEPRSFIGADWLDSYRRDRIVELLSQRSDWPPEDAPTVHLDVVSLPWRQVRACLLSLDPTDADARLVLDLLRSWDGELAVDSAPAAIFELFLAGMARRIAEAKAPRASRFALGAGFAPLVDHSLMAVRRTGHLVALLCEQPAGWFDRPWAQVIEEALAETARALRKRRGSEPASCTWGSLRQVSFRHIPRGSIPGLASAFNIGPIPFGGDANTVFQASSPPNDPAGQPLFVPSLRFVVEIGHWDEVRMVIPGGRSGNPLSRHYRDLLDLWCRGEFAIVPFSRAAVAAASVSELLLEPARAPAQVSP